MMFSSVFRLLGLFVVIAALVYFQAVNVIGLLFGFTLSPVGLLTLVLKLLRGASLLRELVLNLL